MKIFLTERSLLHKYKFSFSKKLLYFREKYILNRFYISIGLRFNDNNIRIIYT